MGRIEPNWKDEILVDNPRYRIRDNNGNIIQDNVSIEEITPTLQEATELNKLNLSTPIGEIRMFNSRREDEKYLLCDGSNFNMIDYPHLAELFENSIRTYSYYPKMIDPTFYSTYGATTYAIRYMSEIGLYVAVGSYQSTSSNYIAGIFTSSDGVTWTRRYVTNGSNSDIKSYFSNGGILYVPEFGYYLAYGQLRIMYSTDCVNWSNINIPFRQISTPIYSQKLNKVVFSCFSNSTSSYTCFLDEDGNLTYSSSSKAVVAIYELGDNLYACDNGTTMYIGTDGINWSTAAFGQFDFYIRNAVKLGDAYYAYISVSGGDTYSAIDKLKNGSVQRILRIPSVHSYTLIKVTDYILFITATGDIYRVDETGATFVRNIGKTNVNYAHYLSTTNEILLANVNNMSSSNNNLIRLDASTLEIKTNSADKLYQNYGTFAVNVENEVIFAQLDSTSGGVGTSDLPDFCVFDNRQLSLPNLSDDGKFAYIKATDEGGE